MKVIYKCAAILTAAILSVQFPCAAFADMEHGGDNDSPKFKMGRIIFTDNGYGYEKEGLEKSEIADEDLVDTDDGVSPYAQKATASLPAKYDPRSKNTLTTIKNQFQTGTCWAFAALSCTESNLIQKGLENQNVQFSVPSLVLSTYANGGFYESIWDCGGTWMDSSLAMAAHRGLCYDEYEPFVSDGTEATIVSEEKKGVCEYQLNYASTITGGRNAIKNKIKELGGVMVSYYADDLYMTFDNKSYYDPETTKYSGINHAVSVVGWDDNYSKSNFLAGYQPKKTALSNVTSSAAYSLNTVGGKQTDSGRWTMAGGKARLTRPGEQASHKITFEAPDGKHYACTDNDGKVKYPVVKVQSGYALKWYKNGIAVDANTVYTADSTVKAKLVEAEFVTIDYVLNGGTNSTGNPEYLSKGEGVTLSEPTKEGADFAGWYDNAAFSGERIESISYSGGAKTLYAAWKPYTYNVTFVDKDGKVISQQTVEYGKSAKAPKAPAIKGLRFTGWDKDYKNVTEDMTVTAEYSDSKLIADCEISGFKNSFTYTGKNIEQPDVTLTYEGKELKEGVDYTVYYKTNLNAGPAKMTFVGKGEYRGSVAKSFTIQPKDASKFKLYYATPLSFTGKEITPDVLIKDGNKTLERYIDYMVMYFSNVNVGTGNISVEFYGNYKGKQTVSFVINPAKQQIQVLETRYKGFFVDFVQKGSATGYEVQYGTRSDFSDASTYRSTTNKTDKMMVLGLGASKTYYVRVRSYTVKGGKTYYGNWSDAKSIVTAKTNFANAKVSGISSKSFTGKAITQKITVKYGSKTLKNGTDYTVKYSANTKVGTAKVTITGKGIYGGVITKSFAIYPAKQVIQKLYGTYAGFFIDYAQKGSATGYEISYSQRSDFKGAKSVKVTNNRTDKKTVSGLARYQKYYVRVRSYTVKGGKTYNGVWSDKKWVYTQ